MFEKNKQYTFDYTKYLYVDSSQKDAYKYGIYTNVKTKDQMVSIFYDYVVTDPELIYSNDLINQLSIIEKKSNGSVAAKYGHHDDLFMASCFCAYVKKKTITNPTYSTIDSVKSNIRQLDKEDEFLVNNILLSGTRTKSNDLNIFHSERELIKSIDDFDDFAF